MSKPAALTAEIVDARPDRARIRLAGHVDFETVPALTEVTTACLADGARWLELDLRDVDFFDSMGLGALVTAYQRSKAVGGGLRLIAPVERVRAMLMVTGLNQIFELVD